PCTNAALTLRRTYVSVPTYVRRPHMSKTLTATELRANLYKVLAELKTSGKPRLVTSNGCTFEIRRRPTAPRKRRDLSKIPRREDGLNCTFDELVATTFPYEPKDFDV